MAIAPEDAMRRARKRAMGALGGVANGLEGCHGTRRRPRGEGGGGRHTVRGTQATWLETP